MSQSFVKASSGIPANTSISEKRTTITSTSGGGGLHDDDSSVYYKSSITPRSSSLQRNSMSSMPTSPHRSSSSHRTVEISSYLPSSNATASGVNSFKTHREQEKKDLRDLNERFANYIEKVRFLEAQNKKLSGELDQLRSHWGKETSAVKLMYETELDEARKLIDETNKEKSRLQLRVGQVEEQLDDQSRQLEEAKKWRSQDRETINKLNQQLSELEGEIRMLRRSNDSMDTERTRDKATISRLQDELEKLRMDLSNETIGRLDAENKYQTLIEEIDFLKSVHEQELKELSALAYRDTTAENREFWKNELSQAIRDIQQEYDIKVDQIRGEMETFYNLKVQEFRTGATKQNMEVTHAREESKKLHKQLSDSRGRLADLEARNAQLEKQYQELMRELDQKDSDHVMETNSLKEEMNKLRAEMEGMLVELQTLMDAKLSLELEIAAYRKLLEGEETRVGLRSVVEQTLGVRQSGAGRLADIINVAQTSEVETSENYIVNEGQMQMQNQGQNQSQMQMQNQGHNQSQMQMHSQGQNQSQMHSQGQNQSQSQMQMHSQVQSQSHNQVDILGESSQLAMRMMRGEVSAKTTYQRTANGPVSIAEANPEGKFVMLENNPSAGIRKDLNLDGWKVRRVIDGQTKRACEYTFRNFVLKPSKSVKVYSRGSSTSAGPNDLVFRDADSWGAGAEVVTTLINDRGEEKASHIQKTNYN